MTARLLPFPARTPPELRLVDHDPGLADIDVRDHAALVAQTRADIRQTLVEHVLPLVRTTHMSLDVMARSLVALAPRDPDARALRTEAEVVADLVEALALLAGLDPRELPPPTWPGAA